MESRFLTKASLSFVAILMMGTFSQFANAKTYTCPSLKESDCKVNNMRYQCSTEKGWTGSFSNVSFNRNKPFEIKGGTAVFDPNKRGICLYVVKQEEAKVTLPMHPPQGSNIVRGRCTISDDKKAFVCK